MIRRPPRSTLSSSSAASDVYKRQVRGIQMRGMARMLTRVMVPRVAQSRCPSAAVCTVAASHPPMEALTGVDGSVAHAFYLSEAELTEIWGRATNGEFPEVVDGDTAREVVRMVVAAQRVKLEGLAAREETEKQELEAHLWHWSVWWKQWGLKEQIEEHEDLVHSTEEVLGYMDAHGEDLVERVMEAVPWTWRDRAGGESVLRRKTLVDALRGVVELEVEELKEAVRQK
eukprot:TRINITY_DN3970_c0_g1_i4.p1 TRINITY_DN3970_c0_g1~~TRINITY_DN3970_c0_g1_i4.p1  ORF type:complete len:229 (+),score=51.56 TRINITY_DN3970_c0_g1_i4:85-771(+)